MEKFSQHLRTKEPEAKLRKKSTDTKDELIDIGEEIELLKEIKDIRDEIRIILKVLDEQSTVFHEMITISQSLAQQHETQSPQSLHGPTSRWSLTELPSACQSPTQSDVQEIPVRTTSLTESAPAAYLRRRQAVDANVRDFKRMLDQADAVYDAVRVSNITAGLGANLSRSIIL